MVIYIVIGICVGLFSVATEDSASGFFKAWSIGIIAGCIWPLIVLAGVNGARKG